jgi:hypothetical protein
MSRRQAQPGVMPAAMSESDFERAIAAPGVVPVAIRTRRAGLRRSIRKTAVAVVGAVALTAAATPTANAQTGVAGATASPCSTQQGTAIGATGNVPVQICSGGGLTFVAPVIGQIASVIGPTIMSDGLRTHVFAGLSTGDGHCPSPSVSPMVRQEGRGAPKRPRPPARRLPRAGDSAPPKRSSPAGATPRSRSTSGGPARAAFVQQRSYYQPCPANPSTASRGTNTPVHPTHRAPPHDARDARSSSRTHIKE